MQAALADVRCIIMLHAREIHTDVIFAHVSAYHLCPASIPSIAVRNQAMRKVQGRMASPSDWVPCHLSLHLVSHSCDHS